MTKKQINHGPGACVKGPAVRLDIEFAAGIAKLETRNIYLLLHHKPGVYIILLLHLKFILGLTLNKFYKSYYYLGFSKNSNCV